MKTKLICLVIAAMFVASCPFETKEKQIQKYAEKLFALRIKAFEEENPDKAAIYEQQFDDFDFKMEKKYKDPTDWDKFEDAYDLLLFNYVIKTINEGIDDFPEFPSFPTQNHNR